MMSAVLRFRPKQRSGIAGLFWTLPAEQQASRIRQLSRSFSAECIATMTRKSVSEVVAIIEGAR
jgi:hypothetical protein